MIAERLAEEILPGLRARMSRLRFVTAIAVSAAVCEGLQDRYASDGVTTPHLVFEWLLVDAFVRACDYGATLGTPGIQKARDVRSRNDAMCARTYLKTPTVFGFHGVYKPLAQHLDVVDDELRLADRGYELLKVWQSEQGLHGFLEGTNSGGLGHSAKQMLRAAVVDSLTANCVQRSDSWQGWQLLANHLVPTRMGSEEAKLVRHLLADPDGALRGEVCDLLFAVKERQGLSEEQVTHSLLMPRAKGELMGRLRTIVAYEKVGTALEEAFDWIRFLSTHFVGKPVTRALFAQNVRVTQIAKKLAASIQAAESALAIAPLATQYLFAQLAESFRGVRDAETLFESILERHRCVQANKPPEGGKRSWFERSPDGATFVRPPYRAHEVPAAERGWNRPYRIGAVASFVNDLEIAHA
ncbi:MAG: hypothetical protein ACREUL_09100 [Steroidobacteraceae bacterium]